MSAPEREETPTTGEEIHLPGPSLLPLITAVGITLALIGVTLGVPLVIVGLLITIIASTRWIRDVRRDISELPPEHKPH